MGIKAQQKGESVCESMEKRQLMMGREEAEVLTWWGGLRESY